MQMRASRQKQATKSSRARPRAHAAARSEPHLRVEDGKGLGGAAWDDRLPADLHHQRRVAGCPLSQSGTAGGYAGGGRAGSSGGRGAASPAMRCRRVLEGRWWAAQAAGVAHCVAVDRQSA